MLILIIGLSSLYFLLKPFRILFGVKENINELGFASLPIFFILIVCSIIAFFSIKNKSKIDYFLAFNVLCYSVISIMFVRFAFLAIPFILILLFRITQDKGYEAMMKVFIVLIILISFFNLNSIFQDRVPLMTRQNQIVLELLEQNKEVINSWSTGHIIRTFYGETRFRAHPNITKAKLFEEERYYDLNRTTDYYVILFNDFNFNPNKYQLINKTSNMLVIQPKNINTSR